MLKVIYLPFTLAGKLLEKTMRSDQYKVIIGCTYTVVVKYILTM